MSLLPGAAVSGSSVVFDAACSISSMAITKVLGATARTPSTDVWEFMA